MMNQSDVYIVSAVRTPIGSLCGKLSTLKAHELGSIAITESIKRSTLNLNDIEEVILGQALTAGQGQNPARQAAINAGISKETPAYSVNMLCGSGLKAIMSGYQAIRSENVEIVVAGGQESMSQAPHVVHLRNGTKFGNSELVDSMLRDGLTDAFHKIHMGETAENIAKQYSISREEQDIFAVNSQRKTKEAVNEKRFSKEIVPVEIKTRKETLVIKDDEYPKPDTTAEALAKLRPAFLKDGSVTAGNASGINDGAAVVVLASKNAVDKKCLKPLARIVGFAQVGVDPKIMGIGPVGAVKKLLANISWKLDDVDLFEFNEAFAVQSIAVIRELAVDPAKVNVNGGAIALGHPIGASGARILVTLLYSLLDRNLKRGIAALCIGGGMGIAVALEMC